MKGVVRRPRSLRRQLLTWLTTLHIVAMIGTAWFSYGAYERLVHSFMDDQMRLVASSYAAAREATALPLVKDMEALRQGAFVVQVWSSDGRSLLASSWAPLALPLQQVPGFSDVQASPGNSGLWRVYTAEAARRDDPLRVQVLQSESFRHQRVVQRALFEGLPIALLLPVALFILWIVVSAASRSLRGVARDVAAQDEHRLTPLSLAHVPDEITPLVNAFNMLLARLRIAFAGQQRFVQDAAHELRTPMAAIGLQIENLRTCIPPGDATERFAQLEAGVTRAQRLIEQLLRLSRQDDLGATSTSGPVNIALLLRESIGQLMVLADQRHIDVGFEGSVTPIVNGSAAELRSVFDNLIDNALRYTHEGGVVDVCLHEIDGHAVVDVSDNGPGIPPKLLRRVFDRFFRVPGSAAGGSGLGLAIAEAVAVRHGLRIELHNRQDLYDNAKEAGRVSGLLARVHLPV
jgi:two-component system OmpR family sensor kinase